MKIQLESLISISWVNPEKKNQPQILWQQSYQKLVIILSSAKFHLLFI